MRAVQGKRQVLQEAQTDVIRYDPRRMLTESPPPDVTRATAPAADVAVSAIDGLLLRSTKLLRLPAPLEARFLQDHTSRRLRQMMGSGVLVSFLYNWLLIADAVMIPDQFDQALKLRLLVFTPLTLLWLLFVNRVPSTSMREGMILVSSLVAAGISTYLCVSSDSPNAAPYLVNLASIVVFSNTVARIRFGRALALDTVIVGLFIWGSTQIPNAPRDVMLPAAVMMLSLSIFTLYGCLMLELDERRTWLIRLRERRLREELMQANARLDAASRHDALTGLPNRHHFEDTLSKVWDEAARQAQPLSMILLDVDHFRLYNTQVGQDQGDACLRLIAAALKRQSAEQCVALARYGGEEFALLCVGASVEHAAHMAQTIRHSVSALHLPHAQSPHGLVSVSAGVASIRPASPHATSAQLIAAADEALRQAKHQGGNTVFAFGTDG